MVATVLRLIGIDVKRLARETAITIVFAVLGAFAAMLALTFSFVALYLWLELKLGAITALGILGGTSALLAGIFFAVAFLPASRKPRARADGALRAAADPEQASTAAVAQAADEAGERSSRYHTQRLTPADRWHRRCRRTHRLGSRAPILGPKDQCFRRSFSLQYIIVKKGCPLSPCH